ncbi:MAG: hypothetical protein Q7U75_17665 [Desulfobacterales bacterium]|nr:hypothetical protein [Desulfobacterales bacterium]
MTSVPVEFRTRPWRTANPRDGKPVTAWYRPGRGYLCGDTHTALAVAMLDAGVFVPEPDDEPGMAHFSTMMAQGWVRAGVVGPVPNETVFVAGRGLDLRSSVVRKVVRDFYDLDAVRFRTRLEVLDESRDRHLYGEAHEVL